MALSETDHDLLIRIDERTEAYAIDLNRLSTDVDKLKSWKNKTIGAISIIGVVVGYIIYLLSLLFELFKS
ncbi:hypothetical protein KAR04_00130 [Candidatus Calescamantes bacterium]|nr:hypothetical protein [Candidatus Calescamantes bacterium]